MERISNRGRRVECAHILDTRMWDEQWYAFTRDYRVIRNDIRGFGRSALPSGESYAYHEDLKALLETLGIERAYILGLSMGGGDCRQCCTRLPTCAPSII